MASSICSTGSFHYVMAMENCSIAPDAFTSDSILCATRQYERVGGVGEYLGYHAGKSHATAKVPPQERNCPPVPSVRRRGSTETLTKERPQFSCRTHVRCMGRPHLL
ncbi:hypothetical protein M413DRAFT_278170 [Hebeloma cylindrosporum]|uniref:Uncharacterized protein n=1 Tax=Hebeloma cylindrosporum TaxID=76867 RepID=A0A0C3BKW9_HEBCY|nr:hypothetical protein M413DRAFT_278170 [Hebeloma cylindrosporum h7]